MAKWSGKIGFSTTIETEPGLWEETIVEKTYYGDVASNRWKRQNSGEVNDNINVSNVVSILSDPFASNNLDSMIYIEFMNSKWRITDVEIQYPRLILSIGGKYNG